MSLYPNIELISINRCVPYYLMSSYLYYERNDNVLTDIDYDKLCKRIIKEWDNITHIHKPLVDKEMLAAGTGYKVKYTNMIISAANLWLDDWQKEIKEQ
tara:strand:- start:2113 stop:2409 length:297 start_codon:yes stop_codon:yes gene_type:complete